MAPTIAVSSNSPTPPFIQRDDAPSNVSNVANVAHAAFTPSATPSAHDSVRDIEIYLELQKSHVDKKTGRIWVHGVATDNSVDFQNDIVQLSQIGTNLSILNRGWGKFNFEHHKEKIGEITKVAFISPEEAFTKYGIQCVGTVLELEGFVYAVTDKTPENSDVREVHKLIDAGARLGFSLQGGIVQRIKVTGKDGKVYNVAVPSFVNLCAITTQPVNMNTICLPFAKSLAAVLCEGGLSEEQWAATGSDNKLAPMLFMGDAAGVDELLKSVISSALASTGGQALVGALGGDAVRLGAVDDSLNDSTHPKPTENSCPGCGNDWSENTSYCPNCGGMKPTLKKAITVAASEFLIPFQQTLAESTVNGIVNEARKFADILGISLR